MTTNAPATNSPEPDQAAQTPERDAIDAALHRQGIHDGFPQHRRSLAISVQLAGITADDIDLLAEVISPQRKKESDSLPNILFSILKDTKQAKERIADMRRGQQLREEARAKRTKHYPGSSYFRRPFDDTDAEPIDDGQLGRIAHAIVVSDRKTAEEAAEFLGTSTERVLAALEEYRKTIGKN